MKKYILIAGVNGAGKSTLYYINDSLNSINRINTDEIVHTIGDWRNISDVARAGRMAISLINDCFSKNLSFNQETTLCGNSIFRNINKAKELGYVIELHYVGLNSPELAKERIRHRVEMGGHGIPDEDVDRRYVESLKNLKRAIPLADITAIYDNTVSFRRFAIFRNGKLYRLSRTVPEWFNNSGIIE